MCRLFGLTSGTLRSTATFWLLEAPDSIEEQSRRNPDGTGLGVFRVDGTPEVHKQPLAAFEDASFVREALHCESTTFVAHVRYATNGADAVQNTHPFEMDGRLFAHNGVVGDVEALDKQLGADLARVAGDTDSERCFALISREIANAGGDVGAGIAAAAGWIAATLPVYSLNFVLVTAEDLWAFRYPGTHELHVLERGAGGPHGDRHLDLASSGHTVRVRSEHLKVRPCVVVASEPMDEDPAWRALGSGELIRVGPDLKVDSTTLIDHPPAKLMQLHEV
jgi:glutamine amidotransferase